MSLTLNGDTGVTFPNGTAQASAGQVLQVVNATYGTEATTTSTSFSDSGLTASITPKFSTSKILVLVSMNGTAKWTGDGGAGVGLALLRNATSIVSNWSQYLGYTSVSGINAVASSVNYLDSPATTSSTTYKVQFKSTVTGTSVYVQRDNAVSTITLMEIAG